MSDQTPHDDRPADPPSDPTAPPPTPPADPADPVPPQPAPEPVPSGDPLPSPPPPPPTQEAYAPAGQQAYAAPPPPPYQQQGYQQGQPQQGYQQPAYQQPYAGSPRPAAPLSPQEEKTWGMLSHVIGAVAMVATSGVLGFVGSLVIYLMYKDRGPFVRAHAANSLNIQITTAIGVVVSFLLMFVLIGFVTIVLVGIWALVMHVVGAIRANNGDWWDPPLVPKFVR